jgi:hypothetical protein
LEIEPNREGATMCFKGRKQDLDLINGLTCSPVRIEATYTKLMLRILL